MKTKVKNAANKKKENQNSTIERSALMKLFEDELKDI
jgi:hypothetical protein